MRDYMFCSESDGGMYDTRREGWHKRRALRPNYRQTHARINTVADVKATLRAGEFAWPGGYPMFFVTGDGAALHFDCVRDNFRSVVWSIRNKVEDGWRVVGCEINYEETDLYCDHCGERIESAYGEADVE